MSKNELHRLKEDFRKFCGLLSIKEIMSNIAMIQIMERLERMLQTAGA